MNLQRDALVSKVISVPHRMALKLRTPLDSIPEFVACQLAAIHNLVPLRGKVCVDAGKKLMRQHHGNWPGWRFFSTPNPYPTPV